MIRTWRWPDTSHQPLFAAKGGKRAKFPPVQPSLYRALAAHDCGHPLGRQLRRGENPASLPRVSQVQRRLTKLSAFIAPALPVSGWPAKHRLVRRGAA